MSFKEFHLGFFLRIRYAEEAPLRMPYLKKQKRLKEMGQNNQKEQKKFKIFCLGLLFAM